MFSEQRNNCFKKRLIKKEGGKQKTKVLWYLFGDHSTWSNEGVKLTVSLASRLMLTRIVLTKPLCVGFRFWEFQVTPRVRPLFQCCLIVTDQTQIGRGGGWCNGLDQSIDRCVLISALNMTRTFANYIASASKVVHFRRINWLVLLTRDAIVDD